MTKLILNSEWLARLNEFTRLIVGFSGGLDSTVLLHVIASHSALRSKLIAVHVHHGMSTNASFWQNHCAQLCQDLDIKFLSRAVQFNRLANLEEEARVARYAVFSSLLSTNDCLLLGHHRDDQAETVLLQLFRGAGIDGLAAMAEFSSLGLGTVARPFLAYSRQQLEEYAKKHELKWIEDESNEDIHYSRNYLRHQIMPLLIKKWPGVTGAISRTAAHCQQAKANLEELAIEDNHGLAVVSSSLLIDPLKKLSTDRLSNVIRVWLKKNQVQMPSTATFQRLINEILLAGSDATPEVSWDNIQVRRYQHYLYINKHINKRELPSLPGTIEWTTFPAPLIVQEHAIHLIAKPSTRGLVIPQQGKIVIRFRQGGEQIFWHGQTKQLKKLFQEWTIPPWQRDRVPLVYINDQLAAVVGYAVSDLFFSKNAIQAWELLANGEGLLTFHLP